MKRIVFYVAVVIFLSFSITSYSQSVYEENTENFNRIVTGTIGIIDKIAYDIRVEKSRKKLAAMHNENRIDADCWHIDENSGDLIQDVMDCIVGDMKYMQISCSSCREKQEEYEHRLRCVDLGLPSGTLWDTHNDEQKWQSTARIDEDFPKHLPSKEQFEELIHYCTWSWYDSGTEAGYVIQGKNGNSIFLPAAGLQIVKNGKVYLANRKTDGLYLSSTKRDGQIFALLFTKDKIEIRAIGGLCSSPIRYVY